MKIRFSIISICLTITSHLVEANDSIRIVVDNNPQWTDYHTTNINSENGLPNNIVTDVYLTDNNFLWITTQQGIVRYDGRSCVAFNKSNCDFITSERFFGFTKINDEVLIDSWGGKLVSIHENGVQLKKGNEAIREKYFIGYRGNYADIKFLHSREPSPLVNVLHGENEVFLLADAKIWHSTSDEENPIVTDTIYYILDLTFNIGENYFYVNQGNLIRFHAQGVDTVGQSPLFQNFSNSEEPFESQILWNLNRSDECYLIKDQNLYSLNFDAVNNILNAKLILRNLPNEKFTCAVFSKELNTLFMGTEKSGLLQINPKSISQFNSSQYCEDNFRHYALVEIGTDSLINAQGLIYTPDSIDCSKSFQLPTLPHSLFYDKKRSNVLIETRAFGIGYYPCHNGEFMDFQKIHLKNVQHGRGFVAKESMDTLFLFLGNKGLCKLIGDTAGLVYRINHRDLGILQNVLFYTNDLIYLGYEFGMVKIDLNAEATQIVEYFNGKSVRGLVNYQGDIWASTYGDGIFILRKGEGNWSQAQLATYPQTQTTHSLIFKEEKVYMSTNTGLYQFNIEDIYRSIDQPNAPIQGFSFRESDGLSYYEFNGGGPASSVVTSTGSFGYPTLKGIIWFHPKQFMPPKISPDFHLARLKINGKDTLIENEIELDPNYSSLEFKFLHPFYGNPINAKVYYRIPEISNSWQEQNMSESFKFDRLPSGSYTIEVNVPGIQKADDRIQSLITFTVLPHFYETTGFIVLLILAFSMLLTLALLLQRKRALAQQKKLEGIIELRTKDLAKTNEELSDSLILRNKMITIFSHDVRGPFRFLKELAYSAREKANKFDYSQIKTELELVYDSVSSSSNKAENLLSWIKQYTDENSIEKLQVNLTGIIKQVIEAKALEMSKYKIKIDFNESLDYWVKLNPGDMEVILDNILSNSLKYSQSQIQIEILKPENSLDILLNISDDGHGISDSQKLKMLNEGQPVKSSIGNHGEIGSGLGLYMIREMVINNDGEIKFLNTAEGFRVQIRFQAYE